MKRFIKQFIYVVIIVFCSLDVGLVFCGLTEGLIKDCQVREEKRIEYIFTGYKYGCWLAGKKEK